LPAACNEQEVGGAFHEAGACSIGLLQSLEFITELTVDRQPCGVPPRVRREAIMKQVEAAQILDVEMVKKVAPQFGCGEEVKAQLNMAAVTELDFTPVS
jgi:hypothetical protein